MQINSVNSFMQSLSELSPKNDVRPSELTSAPSTIQDQNTGKSFDIRHMSLNELKALIHDSHEKGILSSEEIMDLSTEQAELESFGGYNNDAPMNMIDVVQNHIDIMKSQPQSKGVEYVENALELLKGMDARSKAKIPHYV